MSLAVDLVECVSCEHCNQYKPVLTSMRCACKGNTCVTFVLPHVICFGCAQSQPVGMLEALVVRVIAE